MKNHYFDKNGYYTRSAYAEPKFACPRNALRVEPERKDGFWPKHVNGAWTLVKDMRGTKYFMPDGSESKIIEIEGQLPEGASLTKPEKPKPTLDQAYTQKQLEIAKAHDAFLTAQNLEYSDMEKQTWDAQRTEAEALVADSNAPAPLVRAIAKARGMDVMALVPRIQENVLNWSNLAGHVTGQRLAFQDILDGCTTVDQIEAIAVIFTLPDVA